MSAEQKKVYQDERIKPIEGLVAFKQQRLQQFSPQLTEGTYNPIQFNCLVALEWIKLSVEDKAKFSLKIEPESAQPESKFAFGENHV